MELHRCPPGQAVEEASVYLNRLLTILKAENILLLLSGGSAFNILNHIAVENLGPHVTISVLDERFSADPKINNFLQLRQTQFYQTAKTKNCSFIPTVPQNQTINQFAQQFEQALKNWQSKNPQGKIIITQGIGPDGHTAGIMPFLENPALFRKMFESDHWITGYDAGNKNPHPLRITVSITFLKTLVDHSVVYAVGPDKQPVITKIINHQGNLAKLPSLVIHHIRHAHLFTE